MHLEVNFFGSFSCIACFFSYSNFSLIGDREKGLYGVLIPADLQVKESLFPKLNSLVHTILKAAFPHFDNCNFINFPSSTFCFLLFLPNKVQLKGIARVSFLLELGYNTLKGYFAELYLVDGSPSLWHTNAWKKRERCLLVKGKKQYNTIREARRWKKYPTGLALEGYISKVMLLLSFQFCFGNNIMQRQKIGCIH